MSVRLQLPSNLGAMPSSRASRQRIVLEGLDQRMKGALSSKRARYVLNNLARRFSREIFF